MKQLLSLQYYLTPVPNPDFQFSKITFAFCLLLLAAGVALYFYRQKLDSERKRLKKLLAPYPEKLVMYGLIALALLFFRETGMPYLSMRLWWLVLLFFMLASLIRFARKYQRIGKGAEPGQTSNDAKEKYLPKKKKGKRR